MPRLIYRKKARRDLADIAASIERESHDRAVANAFVNKLFRFCEHLSQLPGLLGRPRPEYGRDYRSVTFGNYIIFLRYAGKGSERSQMHILHVLHGSRDMDAYFSQQPDDEGKFGLNDGNSAAYVAHDGMQWQDAATRCAPANALDLADRIAQERREHWEAMPDAE